MFGKNSEKHKMDFKILENEINQINTPFKQKQHLLSLIKNMIRSIDYLRVNSILKEFERLDDLKLLTTYCTNNGLFH